MAKLMTGSHGARIAGLRVCKRSPIRCCKGQFEGSVRVQSFGFKVDWGVEAFLGLS